MVNKISLYLIVVLYLAAGVNHFVHPAFYRAIMPAWLPWHHQLVIISGVCEIICAVLLAFPATRRVGAWCTIALLIIIFPANIQMAQDFYHKNNPALWIALLRLPLQLVLIWWAFTFTGKKVIKQTV